MRAAPPPTTDPIAKAPRPDANRIALRAARSILEAASPVEIALLGATARVGVKRLPRPTWPAHTIEGLDEAADGPWPEALQLDCAWERGRVALLMSAATRRGKAPYRRIVGIRVAVATSAADQSLLWISIPQAIREGSDGARVWVPSPLRVLDRNGGGEGRGDRVGARERRAALRGAAQRSGLTLASARHVEAFAVRLPEGEVLPLPGDAFTRIVHLALLLLPFAAMSRRDLYEGEPPFDINALPGAGLSKKNEEDEGAAAAAATKSGARLAKIYPLPGGVRHYKTTLDTWLAWIGEAHPPVLMFRDAVREHYGAGGSAAADEYLRLLEVTQLASLRGDFLALTKAGEEYSEDPAPERLFERMRSSFTGLLELLVIAATPGIHGPARRKRLLEGLLERRWRTPSQVRLRRSWLLSMGLIERTSEEDLITAAGQRVLYAHAAEAAEIRRRIEDLFEEDLEADLEKADAAAALEDEDGDEGEGEGEGGYDTDRAHEANRVDDADRKERTAEEQTPTREREPAAAQGESDPITDSSPEPATERSLVEAPIEPPSRWSDPVDLTADKLRPYLHRLRFPDALLHRICAALSSGKHLLLVGPPGTGKTELTLAIGAAATSEGYCHDIFTATASADWTTFDTIGGYAIQKGGAVRFRPGIFLRAIERRQWLLIDELNRADIDRAFGELLTVLAGRGASTPFALDDGRLVSIGPDAGCSHRVPPSFRLLATMNTWDRTSLYRLSYAVERRFATVHVDAPDDATYAALMIDASEAAGSDPPLDARSSAAMQRLFRSSGVLALRSVGPAIAVDMIRYMRRRGAGGDGFLEAASMILFPQLEGLEPMQAAKAYDLLASIAAGWASQAQLAELRARLRDLFPRAQLSAP